ncbi:MAG: glycosyltransferase family 39 protein, partial [Acidobacteriaceae bacterium]|nr:glycosyltransferase family 39 protein [Acidobacteriaceae bacterium]
FLEKPPLKFWMVAAPIKLGLLPHDEFGLRFWDAVCGSLSFVYVFLIGSLIAGPICGAVAVLILFAHTPLIFEHGLRTNNMEAALLLSYCGGLFHFLRWQRTGQWRHAIAVGLFFVLGFMTKFVAVAFLPIVMSIGSLLFARERRQLMRQWKTVASVAALAVALIAPWFVYSTMQFGSLFWDDILAESVYARFTTGLNPEHIQPWFFYVSTAWQQFEAAGIGWLVMAGMLLLGVQSMSRRWFEGTVVLLWAVVPALLISLGSSKLYHYAYPFLPPVALGAGYAVVLVVLLLPVQLRKVSEWIEDAWVRLLPRGRVLLEAMLSRRVLACLLWTAVLLAVITAITGGIHVNLGRGVVVKSSGVLRPLLAAVVLGILARRSAIVAVPLVVIGVVAALPFSAYADNMARLGVAKHPMRDASECVAHVQRANPALPRGLFVDTDAGIWHPITYYFRRIQPWMFEVQPSPALLEQSLKDPASLRPSLVEAARYHEYRSGADAARFNTPTSPPMIGLNGYALLLPGPYSVCSPESALARRD